MWSKGAVAPELRVPSPTRTIDASASPGYAGRPVAEGSHSHFAPPPRTVSDKRCAQGELFQAVDVPSQATETTRPLILANVVPTGLAAPDCGYRVSASMVSILALPHVARAARTT
ncbi:hypothetical protein AURDEDRAFT_161024 [Auricularia subglabra TFB-10046 SS5]|nr:hypothetical protein AURDEDRAFT_161024 [Auricularia subglabra TFB-10046 SS5]